MAVIPGAILFQEAATGTPGDPDTVAGAVPPEAVITVAAADSVAVVPAANHHSQESGMAGDFVWALRALLKFSGFPVSDPVLRSVVRFRYQSFPENEKLFRDVRWCRNFQRREFF